MTHNCILLFIVLLGLVNISHYGSSFVQGVSITPRKNKASYRMQIEIYENINK
jgi:hypothetical protein